MAYSLSNRDGAGLQFFEFDPEFLRNHIRAVGQDLPEFDERGAEIFDGHPDPFRSRVDDFVDFAAPFSETGVREQLPERMLDQDSHDLESPVICRNDM